MGRRIAVSDGTELAVIEAGEGRPLLMLPGWSQTAEGFAAQIEAFAAGRRVIALDHRGHGTSAKPDHGYSVHRLAKDLHDVITALGLDRPDALGHSMGCSVIWAHHALFAGEQDLGRLILVDEAPAPTAQPYWDERTRLEAGCLMPSAEALSGFIAVVREARTAETTVEVIRGMFTARMPADDLLRIAAGNLDLPREHAATLLWDHATIDWRPEISRLRHETLVIGAEASIFSARSQEWIAEQIPCARCVIFGADEGGSHFMFHENPGRFNDEVLAFLDG